MSCLVLLKAKKVIENNGASNISLSHSILLSMDEYMTMKKTIDSVDSYEWEVDSNNKDIHEIFDHHKLVNSIYLKKLESYNHQEMMSLLRRTGNPCNKNNETIAHWAAYTGFEFTIDELLELGNPVGDNGNTIAHAMVQHRHIFSVDSLLKLSNPSDILGRTLGHIMAINGYKFSINDLLLLGNPPDHNGNTIAHTMASKGYIFDANEIKKLKNPKNKNGVSLQRMIENIWKRP